MYDDRFFRHERDAGYGHDNRHRSRSPPTGPSRGGNRYGPRDRGFCDGGETRDRDCLSYRKSSRKDQSPQRNQPYQFLSYDDEDYEISRRRDRGRDDYGRDRSPRRERDYSPGRGRETPPDDRGHSRQRDWHAPYQRRGRRKTLAIDSLPEGTTERDIMYGLDRVSGVPGMSTESVKLVRIRSNRRGRRFALVEFYRASAAEDFYDRHSPIISFPLEHSRGPDSKVFLFGIDFDMDGDEEDRDEFRGKDNRDEDWRCRECRFMNFPSRFVCHKCGAERRDDAYEQAAGPVLTGETDEDPQQMPSHFVVVRDLGSNVNEEILAKGIAKLFVEDKQATPKETPAGLPKLKVAESSNSSVGLGAKTGSLRRVFLMRDRRTDASWNYGFAEFATVEDAKGAVAKFRASAKFTIASKPVVVAFIHTGVFIPGMSQGRQEDEREFFTPMHNAAIRLKYWDDRAYPNAHVVATEPSLAGASPEKSEGKADANPSGPSTKSGPFKTFGFKKGRKDKESAGKTIAMAPQMQMWAKKSAELHAAARIGTAGGDKEARQTEQVEDDEASSRVPSTQPDGPVRALPSDQYTSYADWDALKCLLCQCQALSQADFEAKVSAEGMPFYTREQWLIDHEVKYHNHYFDAEVKTRAAALLSALGKEPRTIVRRTPRQRSQPLVRYTSYADHDALVCYLCMRRLASRDALGLHERESELHRRVLGLAGRIDGATAKLAEMGKKPMTMVPKSERHGEQYRDRAQERRAAFNQPSRPKPGVGKAAGSAGKESAPACAAPEEQQVPLKKSKGAGMLTKMGWTEGAGLGAGGTGRMQAVATEAYAPGVGLGAEGGKLGDAAEAAVRKTTGHFGGFVEKTKDRARERFEKMG